MAVILLSDGTRETISVLEIDARGTDNELSDIPISFGVHRGDFVFVHKEGTNNGCDPPFVPHIGELEEWAHEPLIIDDKGHLTGWRNELDAIGSRIAHSRGKEPVEDGMVTRPVSGDVSLNWFGEVRHVSHSP